MTTNCFLVRCFRFRLLLLLALTWGAVYAQAAETKVRVTTTVTMLTDLVKNIGGDRVQAVGLMGPGVDPHLYKAAASDVSKLQNADVIFYVGLLLEGKMQDLFTQMARRKKFVYPVSEAIPVESLLEPPEFAGHYDPHVWFDILLWAKCAKTVAEGLSEFDPAGRAHYEARSKTVQKAMEDLHRWALTRIEELPKEKRVLVTSHDAFNYFGRAFGFQVVGLQGVSTVTEAGLADMAKMVDFVKKKKVKAIFVESSVPHNTIDRISKDAGVKIGGELFSDAMGTPGQMERSYDLGTYDGMIRHNVNTIVDALR